MNKIDRYFLQLLKKHEGFRESYYYCTSNKKTIGYGRNVDDNPFTKEELDYLNCFNADNLKISKKQAEYILINDMTKVNNELKRKLHFYNDLLPEVQHILVNMAFNMGTRGLMKFINTLKLLKESRFKDASIEMLNSRWANQVGNRAVELSNILSKI